MKNRFKLYWNQRLTVIWDTIKQKRVETDIWNYLKNEGEVE